MRELKPTPNIRLILGVFNLVLALTLIGVEQVLAAEYYQGEPRSKGYTFAVPEQCPANVRFTMAVAANRFNTFLPVSVVDGPIKGVIYDGVDSVTCGTFPPELRLSDCWNDRGLLACSEEVKSYTSNAVVGRATWWRESASSTELLECDIQLDPGAEQLFLVAMHETLHCLGLAHQLKYIEGLMYPTLALQAGIHYDDIIGLCHLYDCNVDMLDDSNNLVVQRAVKPGMAGVWRGVLLGGKAILVERVE